MAQKLQQAQQVQRSQTQATEAVALATSTRRKSITERSSYEELLRAAKADTARLKECNEVVQGQVTLAEQRAEALQQQVQALQRQEQQRMQGLHNLSKTAPSTRSPGRLSSFSPPVAEAHGAGLSTGSGSSWQRASSTPPSAFSEPRNRAAALLSLQRAAQAQPQEVLSQQVWSPALSSVTPLSGANFANKRSDHSATSTSAAPLLSLFDCCSTERRGFEDLDAFRPPSPQGRRLPVYHLPEAPTPTTQQQQQQQQQQQMFDEEESSAQQMKRSADVGKSQGKTDLYDGSGRFLWKALPSNPGQ
jgi:hypothetical protein